ncbi:MAG: clostripain-related cysteine peptidase [Leeuwenhoekiella sp.]
MKLNYTLLCTALLIFLISCKSDDDALVSNEPDAITRTALIYIVADNNLNSYAAVDVDEMIDGYSKVEDPENNNLLVYIDDYKTPRLLHITKEAGKVVTDTLYNYEEQNSLNITNMSGVINQAFSDYPATSYGLVLWSHANGWLPGTLQDDVTTKAFGEDLDNNAFSDEGAQMDIIDLKTALTAVPKLEYILFDACDMQGIEVAYELRNIADYFISSPSEVPSNGAPYEDVVESLFSQGDVANDIARAYYGYYQTNYDYGSNTNNSSEYSNGISISVIESSQLEALAAATRNILTQHINNGSSIETTDIYSYDDNYYNFYYDFDSFIKYLTAEDASYLTWLEAYKNAVPLFLTTDYTYSSYTDDGSGGMYSSAEATGISTYIPSNSNFLEAYYWSDYLTKNPDQKSAIEDYQLSYNNYYKRFSWYSASGWSETGW